MKFFGLLALTLSVCQAAQTVSEDLLADTIKYCEGVEVDLGMTRETHSLLTEFIGPVNLLDEIALDPNCGEVKDCFEKYKSDVVGPAIRLGIPVLLFVITIFVWLFFGCCACCRCCRRSCMWCCCKEKKFPSYFTRCTLAFIWSSFALILICAIVDAALAGSSLTFLKRGTDALLCRSFAVVNGVLNGARAEIEIGSTTTTISFIGTEPLYEQLTIIEEMLLPESQTIADLQATVDNTVELDNALGRFTAYLELTQDMLGDQDTLKPQVGGSGEYQCVVCEACCSSGSESYVNQLNDALSKSFAQALSNIRKQVSDTLTGPGLQDTQKAVADAAKVVNDVTTQINDEVGKTMVDNASRAENGLRWLYNGLVILTALVAIVALLFMMSLIYGVAKSHKISYSDPYDKPRNPCVASCGWCFTLFYTFLIFLIGAILMISGYLQASFCDETYDLDTTIDKAFARYAPDVDENDATKVLSESCLKSTSNGDFLTAITVGDSNAREVLNSVADISTLIDEAFNQQQDVPEISTLPEFLLLTESMAAYKGLYMLPADRIAALKVDPTFNVNEPMTESQSQTGYGSSTYCSAQTYDLTRTELGQTIQASLEAAGYTLPGLTTVSIPGVSDYETTVSTIDALKYSGTCPAITVVEDSYNPYSGLLFWKSIVSKKTDFKCSTIQEVQDPVTKVTTFTRVPATCNDQAAFDAYIDSLQSSLVSAALTLDQETVTTSQRIQDEMVSIINDDVVPPVQTVLDNSNCILLRNGFNAFYNTFCPDFSVGVVGIGITFVILGGISLIAVFIMFGIWRNLKDNISLWRDLVKERGDRQTAIRNVVAAVPAPAQVQILPDTGYPPKQVR